MKSIGIIPARGGSKGIPKKNIKNLNGKPLIQYTIEASLKSNITATVVSTDDEEIAKVSEQCGAKVIFRPHDLAQDSTPTLPVLQHVLQELKESYDLVLTLQPTSPLRTAKHIDDAIKLMDLHPEADSLVSVVKVPHNCSPSSIMSMNNIFVEPVEQDKLILRRQDKPVFWARNGAAIYITRRDKINEFIWGGKILAFVMNKIESFDIDDMEDWMVVESLLKSGVIKPENG